MSQNKTFIPEMGDFTSSQSGRNDFYSRSATSGEVKKTYIPDVYSQMKRDIEQEQELPAAPESLRLQDRVLVGVLFSISKTSKGEIYPVYVGRNTIGSDESCDICLSEETVSPKHAVFLVRNITQADGRIEETTSITDYDSEFGTMVGEEKLEYDKVICHDHDIITIGVHYKFLLCLFAKSRLAVDLDFVPLKREMETPTANLDNQVKESYAMPMSELPNVKQSQPIMPEYRQMTQRKNLFNPYSHTTSDGEDHSEHETIIL